MAKPWVLDGVGRAAKRAWRLLPKVEPLESRSFLMVVSSVAVNDAGRLPSAVSMFVLSPRAVPTA